MVAHIVITEGLAHIEAGGTSQCCLSDYFEAVLAQIIENVPDNESVFISPGNDFGCEFSEEEYAAKYLLKKRPDLTVYGPSDIRDRPYLDTFDNARLLRLWLEKQGLWSYGKVILYCNAPHCFRSWLLFQLSGFNVQQVIGCRPQKKSKKIVPRLWFYDYLIVQIFYEILGTFYDLMRFFLWRALDMKFV